MLISDFLLTGEQNAQTAKEICNHARRIGWKLTERQLSKAIEMERRRGVPICASCDLKSPGYYLAADKGEMQRYCDSLRHRAGEIHATRRACMKTITNLPEVEQ